MKVPKAEVINDLSVSFNPISLLEEKINYEATIKMLQLMKLLNQTHHQPKSIMVYATKY